jgi:hypothetical protein
MKGTKIQLSEDELALVKDGEWILTKNEIIRKVISLFGNLSDCMGPLIQKSALPPPVRDSSPKISRGENYRGLPYVVLDYPRLFSKDHVFAIRILFWWAHYFTVSLHLKGSYREMFRDRLSENRNLLVLNESYISRSPEEWLHAVDQEYYILVKNCTKPELDAILQAHSFTKISSIIALDQWNKAEAVILDRFKTLLETLGQN